MPMTFADIWEASQRYRQAQSASAPVADPDAPEDEEFEERAAIMEWDGGLSRAESERHARRCLEQTVVDIFGATPVERWPAHAAALDPPPAPLDLAAQEAPNFTSETIPAISLRDYQEQAVQAILEALGRGEHPVCDMATGGGKSLVIAALCARLSGRILVATHRKELLAQNNAQLARVLGDDVDTGIYSAGLGRRETDARVIFGGVQSIYRQMEGLQAAGMFQYVIVDEAHLVGDRDKPSMYRTVFEACPDAQRIGMSATPYRLDGGSIAGRDGTWFTSVPTRTPISYLTARGFLAPLIGVRAATDIDLSKVKKRQGDWAVKELSDIMSEEGRVRAAVAELKEIAATRKKWLAFCVDVRHAQIVTQAMCAQGIDARLVTGETPQDERDALLSAYRAGEFRCLVNCEVATTGFDIPDIDALILFRPTMSKGLLVQMLGRGTRLAEGKINCVIYDYADTLRRHEPLEEVPRTEKTPRVQRDEDEKEEEARKRALQEKERKAKHRASILDDDGEDHPGTYGVARIVYTVVASQKYPGRSNLRALYHCPWHPLEWITIWLCVEYEGWARDQAALWFARRGLPCPRTAREARDIAESHPAPRTITLRTYKGYPKILGEFWEKPVART